MNILTNCNDINYALNLITQNIKLFDQFNNIFLFGSILHSDKIHNDLDILLIYSIYSERLREQVDIIYNTLNKASELPVDLTVLSISEEKELNFIKKQNLNYLKVK